MIIYKSIFRKKTTKIYLFIVTSIFLIIGILLLARNHYISEGNENYEGSYLTFEAPLSELDKIKDGLNVKSVTIGLTYTFINESTNNEMVTDLIVDESLSGNEIITWASYNYFFNTNEDGAIIINKNNHDYILTVKETYTSTSDDGTHISMDIFNDLYDNENILYRVEIEDYFKENKTTKWLEENISNINTESNGNGITFVENSKDSAPLYNLYVLLFTCLTIGLGIIFFIILIYTLVNMIIDEKKSSNLLNHLGYNHKKILLTTIIKISLILIIPFIISSLILIPIYLIW